MTFRTNKAERNLARLMLTSALTRRAIDRPDACERCGAVPTGIHNTLHGHHEDYTRPYDVDWLCRKCHSQRHAEMAREAQGLPPRKPSDKQIPGVHVTRDPFTGIVEAHRLELGGDTTRGRAATNIVKEWHGWRSGCTEVTPLPADFVIVQDPFRTTCLVEDGARIVDEYRQDLCLRTLTQTVRFIVKDWYQRRSNLRALAGLDPVTAMRVRASLDAQHARRHNRREHSAWLNYALTTPNEQRDADVPVERSAAERGCCIQPNVRPDHPLVMSVASDPEDLVGAF